ncbi:MAG: FO synthase subunit 2 [Promethearchaeota archaeon]|nr:MAG: FO synthase subunit 2 [Candidatus Lokiarchaeota archaeon]
MIVSQRFHGIKPEIKKILRKSQKREDLTPDDALKLLKVSGKDVFALQKVADEICQEKTNNYITFIINRNINFTNICLKKCTFCSFSHPENHQEAFLLSMDEIEAKVLDATKKGCTEVCIQGGINPNVTFDYYLEILKTVKNVNPKLHIHAFSPQEIFHMATISGNSIVDTLKELRNAGLDSIPGTAAEILVDNIRKIICPNKISSKQWINIISNAHELRIPTTSTMMYGHIESLEDRIEHLTILRNIQKKTGGFTEFVPLPFVKENPTLSKLKNYPLKPSYGFDDLKLFCIARLFLNNFIDNIQASWVKLGPKFAQVSLNYGVNDFSGTLMEENISRSAGAEFGQIMEPKEIINIINNAGKIPAQRDTLYNIIKKF